jgi:hypothetical protein
LNIEHSFKLCFAAFESRGVGGITIEQSSNRIRASLSLLPTARFIMATSAFEFRLPALTNAQRAAIHRRMRDGRLDYVLDEAKGLLRFVCPAKDTRAMDRVLLAFCKRHGIEKPKYARGVLVQTSVAEYLRKGVSPGFALRVADVVDACIERGVEQAVE